MNILAEYVDFIPASASGCSRSTMMTMIIHRAIVICALGVQGNARDVKIGVFLENAHGNERLAVEYTRQFLMTSNSYSLSTNVSVIVKESRSKNGVAATLQVCEMFEEGIRGLISYSSCDTQTFLQSQTRLFRMPHLAVTPVQCASDEYSTGSYTLHMREKGTYLVEAVVDVVTHLSWKDLTLFYDDSYASLHLSALLFNLSSHFIQSAVVSVMGTNDSTAYYEDKMLNLAQGSTETNNFLLMVSHAKAIRVLNAANQIGLLSPKTYWIVVSNELSNFTTEVLEGNDGNIILMKKRWHQPACTGTLAKLIVHRIPSLKISDAYLIDALVIVARTVSDEGNTTEGAESISCEEQPFQHWGPGPSTMETLRQTDVFGMTGHLSFDVNDHNNNSDYEMFTVDTRDELTKLLGVAKWDKETRLQTDQENIFPNSGLGLGNITFMVGTKEALPFIKKLPDARGFEGFCIDILNELALRLNFRYELAEPSDGQWGSEEQDGTFNGIVGMVIEKKLDFGVGPISINAEREKGIDFTKPFLEDGVGIIMKRPTDEPDKIYRMFRPFSGGVWATLAASVLAIGVGLYIVSKISPFGDDNERAPVANERSDYSLKENVWLIFSSLMEQGGENLPTAVSGRVILGFWWLFTILMVSSYTANLAAFLTVTIAEKPIKNLEELASQTEMKPLVKTGTNVYSLFRSGGNDAYQKIWKQIGSGPKLTENAEAYDLVRTGEYAFMTDKAQLEYLVKRDCETFVLADESFNNAGFGFVFPENSPYLEEFSYNIIKMQEAGLIERWRVKWWPTSDTCSSSGPTSEAKRLGLDSTGGPFFIFILSACASFLCLMLEVAYARLQYKKLVLHEAADGTKPQHQ